VNDGWRGAGGGVTHRHTNNKKQRDKEAADGEQLLFLAQPGEGGGAQSERERERVGDMFT